MASGVKQVRMNNAVRGAIDAALGSLQLFAADPATRLPGGRGGVPFA